MAIASTITAIPLDLAARSIGLNPAHFNQCAGNTIWPICDACGDIWYQRPWQAHNGLSREAFAEQLLIAENEISSLLRTPIAPRKVTKSFFLNNDQIDAVNNRAFIVYIGEHIHDISALNANEAITVSVGDGMEILDENSDSVPDAVEVTVALPEGALESDIRIYYGNHAGEDAYEIRDVKSRTLIEIDGDPYCILRLEPWQILDLSLVEKAPTGKCALDVSNLSDSGIYTEELEVLVFTRSYVADGFSTVRFSSKNLWDGTETVTNGYHVDVDRGHVAVTPSNYTDGAWVDTSVVSGIVTMSIDYWHGSETFAQGVVEAAASIAISRLSFYDCDCECNADKTWKRYGKDLGGMAEMSYRSDLSNCPFGMRLGEFEAWRRIRNLTSSGVVTRVSVH